MSPAGNNMIPCKLFTFDVPNITLSEHRKICLLGLNKLSEPYMEKVREDDRQSSCIVFCCIQFGVVQNRVEYIQEELQRELVQEMNLKETVFL